MKRLPYRAAQWCAARSVAVAGALSLSACVSGLGGPVPPPPETGPAATVRATPASVELLADGTRQLLAEVDDAKGRPVPGMPLEYRCDGSALIRVSPRGLVTALGRLGSAEVTVTSSGGLRATVAVRIVAGRPARLERLEGDRQSGTVGTLLAAPVRVRVTDAHGNPVANQPIRFDPDEGGSASPARAGTAGDGTVSTAWTLGAKAGTQKLIAAVDGLESLALEAVASSGPLSVLRSIGALPAAPVAGGAIDAAVEASDAHGNPKVGVSVLFVVTGGDGSVAPGAATTDGSGAARTRWTLGRSVGTNHLTVRSTGHSLPPLLLTVGAVAGAPAGIAIERGDRQRAGVGVPTRIAPAVRVTDVYGNPVSAALVEFAADDGSGSVEPATVVTDEHGVAAVRAWRPARSGPCTLVAAVEGLDARVAFHATAR